MTDIFTGRWAARADTDFVVFLIGMRINKPLAFSKWRPVARAMPQMQQELARQPELGCLHIENWFGRTTISLSVLARLREPAHIRPQQRQRPPSCMACVQ